MASSNPPPAGARAGGTAQFHLQPNTTLTRLNYVLSSAPGVLKALGRDVRVGISLARPVGKYLGAESTANKSEPVDFSNRYSDRDKSSSAGTFRTRTPCRCGLTIPSASH